MGAEDRRRAAAACPSWPTSTPTSRTRGWRPISSSTATPRRGSASPSSQIDNTLYDAFGQRQVSTIYDARNQYHVVMEVAPRYWQSPETLKDVYVSTAGGAVGGTQATNAVAGTVVGDQSTSSAAAAANAQAARNQATNAIGATGKGAASTGAAVSTSAGDDGAAVGRRQIRPGATPLAVNHQGLFVANTISFNLPPGVSLERRRSRPSRPP